MSAQRLRRALVFGGSGTVGREVVRQLVAAQVQTVFTYHQNAELAQGLAAELEADARQVDLTNTGAVKELVLGLDPAPDVFVHCAAIGGSRPLLETSDADWSAIHAVNCGAAFVACRELAPAWSSMNGADVVLVGALGRGQSLPIPAAFAASQGALGALAMSMAKELGPGGVRVNTVALGVLESGLSAQMDSETLAHFETFSCLQRRGTASEAARAICWLALSNSYMSGEVIPVNGGI